MNLEQLALCAKKGNSYYKLKLLIEIEKQPQFQMEEISRQKFKNTFGNYYAKIIGYELYAIYHNDQLHNPLLIIALTRRRNIPFDILEQSRINYYLKNPVKVCVIWNTMSRDIPTFTDQDDDDYTDFQEYRDQLNTMEISPIFKALIDGKVVRKECYEFIFSSGIESYRYRNKFMKSIETKLSSKTTANQLKSLFSDFKKSQK